MNLPDIESVSAAVHLAWMDSKRAQGVTSRKSEDGEELMASYANLSEKAKELDRGTVKAVYAAIQAATAAIVPPVVVCAAPRIPIYPWHENESDLAGPNWSRYTGPDSVDVAGLLAEELAKADAAIAAHKERAE